MRIQCANAASICFHQEMSQEVEPVGESGEAEFYFAMKWPETGVPTLFYPEQAGESVPDTDPPVQYEEQGRCIILDIPGEDGTPIRYQFVLYHDGEKELAILNPDPAEGEDLRQYFITDDPDYEAIQTDLTERIQSWLGETEYAEEPTTEEPVQEEAVDNPETEAPVLVAIPVESAPVKPVLVIAQRPLLSAPSVILPKITAAATQHILATQVPAPMPVPLQVPAPVLVAAPPAVAVRLASPTPILPPAIKPVLPLPILQARPPGALPLPINPAILPPAAPKLAAALPPPVTPPLPAVPMPSVQLPVLSAPPVTPPHEARVSIPQPLPVPVVPLPIQPTPVMANTARQETVPLFGKLDLVSQAEDLRRRAEYAAISMQRDATEAHEMAKLRRQEEVSAKRAAKEKAEQETARLQKEIAGIDAEIITHHAKVRLENQTCEESSRQEDQRFHDEYRTRERERLYAESESARLEAELGQIHSEANIRRAREAEESRLREQERLRAEQLYQESSDSVLNTKIKVEERAKFFVTKLQQLSGSETARLSELVRSVTQQKAAQAKFEAKLQTDSAVRKEALARIENESRRLSEDLAAHNTREAEAQQKQRDQIAAERKLIEAEYRDPTEVAKQFTGDSLKVVQVAPLPAASPQFKKPVPIPALPPSSGIVTSPTLRPATPAPLLPVPTISSAQNIPALPVSAPVTLQKPPSLPVMPRVPLPALIPQQTMLPPSPSESAMPPMPVIPPAMPVQLVRPVLPVVIPSSVAKVAEVVLPTMPKPVIPSAMPVQLVRPMLPVVIPSPVAPPQLPVMPAQQGVVGPAKSDGGKQVTPDWLRKVADARAAQKSAEPAGVNPTVIGPVVVPVFISKPVALPVQPPSVSVLPPRVGTPLLRPGGNAIGSPVAIPPTDLPKSAGLLLQPLPPMAGGMMKPAVLPPGAPPLPSAKVSGAALPPLSPSNPLPVRPMDSLEAEARNQTRERERGGN